MKSDTLPATTTAIVTEAAIGGGICGGSGGDGGGRGGNGGGMSGGNGGGAGGVGGDGGDYTKHEPSSSVASEL